MFSGILILVLFFILAGLMFTRRLPTFLALPILAIGIGLIAGMPIKGSDGVLQVIIEGGVTRLAAAYTAVVFGAWLGQIMIQTGISKNIIKFAAELGGDRPFVITILLAAAVALLFTTVGGLGAIIMIGSIVLPIITSVGLPAVSAGAVFLFAFAVGITINLSNWAFYVDATGVPLETVRTFALIIAGVTALLTVLFTYIEFKKADLRLGWAKQTDSRETLDAPQISKIALLTPIVPLILVMVFDWPIISSFIVGILFSLITTQKSFASSINVMSKAVYDGVSSAAPVITLMMGVGMLVNAVFHPEVSAIMQPFLERIIPQSMIGYILFFSLLAPLALYRGPLNMWGLGSGIVGLIISLGLLRPEAAMSALLATERVQAIGDPTNTHNVWTANFVGVDVNQLLRKVFLYIWVLAAIGVIIAAFMWF